MSSPSRPSSIAIPPLTARNSWVLSHARSLMGHYITEDWAEVDDEDTRMQPDPPKTMRSNMHTDPAGRTEDYDPHNTIPRRNVIRNLEAAAARMEAQIDGGLSEAGRTKLNDWHSSGSQITGESTISHPPLLTTPSHTSATPSGFLCQDCLRGSMPTIKVDESEPIHTPTLGQPIQQHSCHLMVPPFDYRPDSVREMAIINVDESEPIDPVVGQPTPQHLGHLMVPPFDYRPERMS
ncbi:hypothetical protein GGS20DRAFT_581154 [Poronia punctata]|nr:hypothetical protein GGS20DRAFT_581154 [Poronia punctata]